MNISRAGLEPDRRQKYSHGDGTIAVAVLVLVVLFSAAFWARPLLSGLYEGRGYLAYYQDDFFYYLKIAGNIAQGLGSTFDGITPTNGYHPLWMGYFVLLKLAVSDEKSLFVLVQATLFLCSAAFIVLMFRLMTRLGWSAALAALGIGFFHIGTVMLMQTGMEVAIAMPLMIGAAHCFLTALHSKAPRHFLYYGFVSSLMILARLDTVLFFAILSLAGLWALIADGMTVQRLPRLAAWLLAGLLPLAFYAASNLYFFGGIAPVSGQAKQIKDGLSFNPLFWQRLVEGPPSWVPPAAFLAAASLLLIASKRLGRRHLVTLSLSLFVFVFTAVHSLISDWYVWPWYFYPMAVAGPVAFAACWDGIASVGAIGPAARRIAVWGCVLVAAPCAVHDGRYFQAGDLYNGLVETGLALRDFSRVHDGVYGMGDRAAVAGYLADMPVVQLEGLVADHRLLGFIRAQAALDEVFAHYGIGYYIASWAEAQGDGCYKVTEPGTLQSGDRSHKMRGILCQPPVFEFLDVAGHRTLVFKISGRPA